MSLLCGDELSAMLGLLSGAPPLEGKTPLVWQTEDPRRPPDAHGVPLTGMQRETRRLIDLAVRPFLARDLLVRGGGLAATLRDSPERGVEHLLDAVFGHSHRFRIPTPTLDRRWIFVRPDALTLALLRERVVARQMVAGAVLHTEEPSYGWVIGS